MRHIWNNEAYDIGLLSQQRSSNFVRLVIQLLHGIVYFFSRFFTDIASIVKDTRDSRY
ncbi:hypothetical protein D3C80_1642120 [compost metagenome]